jgi:hypothetical protein
LLGVANVVPSSLILCALVIEAMLSSEASVPTRATLRQIPEDGILQFTYKSVILFDWYSNTHVLFIHKATAFCTDKWRL